MTYLLVFILIWWAFSVSLIFGDTDRINRIFDKVPTLELWPRHYILAAIFFICVVAFPLVMIAPFKIAYEEFVFWRIRREFKRQLMRIAKGKPKEVQDAIKSLVDKI